MPNRIRELREARGMTLDQLGEAVGTSFQQIARLEGGERRLSEKWIRPIARALGVAPGDLLLPEKPGSPANVGQFVKDPDKLALLAFWDSLGEPAQILFLESFRNAAMEAAELKQADNRPHQKRPRR